MHRVSLAQKDETLHQVSVGFPGETFLAPRRTRSCQNEELSTTTPKIRRQRHNVCEQPDGGRLQAQCRHDDSTRRIIRMFLQNSTFRTYISQVYPQQSTFLHNTSRK